ncbi:MAG: MFS transporter [Deltaproteobacteria bacterium]|nr:MFS transporter [Deltaproteobacteria bacterium]
MAPEGPTPSSSDSTPRMSGAQKRFRLGAVLVVATAHLVHDIFSAFLPPILPLLIRKLHIDYTRAALLNVVRQVPSLLNPFMGLWADGGRLRFLLALGPALTATAMSLLGWADSYAMVTLLLLIVGIGVTCFHVPAPVLIKQASGNRVGRGMSLYMLGGETARALGPIVIVAAVSWWGFEGTWRLIPVGLVASALLVVPLFRMKEDQPNPTNTKPPLPIRDTLIRHRRFLLGMAAFTFLRAMLKSSLTLFLPTYLMARGERLWFAGAALTIMEVAGAAGTLLGGTLSDHLGRKRLLVFVSATGPLAALVFLSMHGWASLLLLILVGFIVFASSPILLALVQETARERPAFLNGIYMTISFAGSSVAVLLVGWLGDLMDLHQALVVASLASLGTVPVVFGLPDPPARPSEP